MKELRTPDITEDIFQYDFCLVMFSHRPEDKELTDEQREITLFSNSFPKLRHRYMTKYYPAYECVQQGCTMDVFAPMIKAQVDRIIKKEEQYLLEVEKNV